MCSSISFSTQKGMTYCTLFLKQEHLNNIFFFNKDILVEFSNDMLRKFRKIIESIKDYVEIIRAEEIRLPKFKVFFNDFESKLKNSEVSD